MPGYQSEKCFAAIDLGATSGRIMLDRGNGKLLEVHRFPTPMIHRNEGIFWDFETLFAGICDGLLKLPDIAGKITAVSCDSWAQDAGLLDEDGKLLGDPFSYRDGKCEVLTRARLQYVEEFFPELFKRTARILHIADLVHYRLCGSARSNYSLAAISGLELNDPLFAPVADCEVIGTINHPALKTLHGIPVISGAGHDTAAAFISGDPQHGEAVTSIGTWQMTAELWDHDRTLPENFLLLPLPRKKYARTRGGMGLWPFQQCVKIWKARGEFPGYSILDNAAAASGINDALDPDTPELFSPENMEEAIFSLAGRHLTPPEITALLLRGTARSIAGTIRSFETHHSGVIAVGGGVNGAYFCSLLQAELPCPLTIGNPEASAAGNIAIQQQTMDRQ